MPKRAMSAFFFWMAENRDKLKKPGMGVADVAKAAGVEWGKLADKSVSILLPYPFPYEIISMNTINLLQKWEKMAEKDKKRYEVAIAAYKGQ